MVRIVGEYMEYERRLVGKKKKQRAPVSRILYPTQKCRVMAIPLRLALPQASSGLPATLTSRET